MTTDAPVGDGDAGRDTDERRERGEAQAGEFVWPEGPRPGDRSTTAFDEYRRSIDSMRETTKWVVSTVSAAAIVAAILGVVPAIASLDSSARATPLWWLAGAAGLLAVAVALAGAVIGSSAPRWSWVVPTYAAETKAKSDGESLRGTAFSNELDREGFYRLYGYSSPGEVFGITSDSDTEQLKFAFAPSLAIADFAAYRKVRALFRGFVAVGVIAVLAAAACIAAASISAADAKSEADAAKPPSVNTPLHVRITSTGTGERRLIAEARCDIESDQVVAAWIANGSLSDAELIIDDPSCDAAVLAWNAETDGILTPVP